MLKVYEAISAGRIETMESQPNARSALRLEALLPDPIEEDRAQRKKTKELKLLLNREEQFRGNLLSFLTMRYSHSGGILTKLGNFPVLSDLKRQNYPAMTVKFGSD